MRGLSQERYYRAISIAEFIIEEHTLGETQKEFSVGAKTIRSDLEFLGNKGYGQELARNRTLYLKAKAQLEKNKRKR